ncbi:uncharacterized protein [Hyperolius riggenbachi]|uniref:uncharacterized protein n=1 Tax=Hyperolius riggenbachi TaxID=752182 RepID=UPI0035A26A0C
MWRQSPGPDPLHFRSPAAACTQTPACKYESRRQGTVIGQLVDMFSSSSLRLEGDKGPIRHSNLEEKFQILQETQYYLLTLATCVRDSHFQTSRSCWSAGLLVNIASLSELLPGLLKEQEYVTTHRFNTYHLQELLNHPTTRGGSDVHPTALEVRCAVEQLLSQSGLLHKKEFSVGGITSRQSLCSYGDYISSPFADTGTELLDHVYSSQLLEMAVHNSAMYIAGWVVRKAFTQLSCNKCRWALVTEQHPQDYLTAYHLLPVKDSAAHFVPSHGTIKAVQTAEKELYHMLKCNSKTSTSAHMLQHRVLLALGSTDIFHLKEHILHTEMGINNHHFLLVRLVTSVYHKLKKPYIDRKALEYQHRKQ